MAESTRPKSATHQSFCASEAKLIGLGCDYITVTSKTGNLFPGLHSVASPMFRNQAEIGNTPRPWGMAGFKGWRCGEVEIGERGDEVLVRASAGAAALNWRTLFERADNCSRLDLQATIRVASSVTDVIDTHRCEAQAYASSKDDKPIVRWTADHRGGYTLYLGARESICFGRIYDKWQQSHLDHFRGCVRYEVQFHNRLAKSIAVSLCDVSSQKTRISQYLLQFFRKRGLTLEWKVDDGATYCCSRQRSDADKSLTWLRSAVRPSVLRLISLGRGEEVMVALGLVEASGLSDSEPNAIQDYTSEVM